MMCFAILRMFGKIAKFFRKSAGTQSESPVQAPLSAPEQKPLGRPKFAVPGMDVAVPGDDQASAFQPEAGMDASDSAGSISVPFNAILPLLPKELLGKTSAGASAKYQLPKTVALEQLSRGAVRVSFGDLRRAAPAGLFTGGSTQDSRMVDLPLREILNQLNPAAFARRPPSNRLTVPDDVTDIFGSRGERLTELRVLDKSELKSTPPAPRSPAPAETPAPDPEPAAPVRIAAPNLAQQFQAPSPTPAPAAIPFPAMQAAPKPVAQPAPVAPKLPSQAPPSMSAVPKLPAAKPTAPTLPPNAIKFPTAHAPQPAMPPQPAATVPGGALSVSVRTVNQKWPEAIRNVVQQLGVTDLEIPNALIETALKLGKIEFQWQQVVTWLRPAPAKDIAADHAGTVLELPLSVVAPLFLQQSRYKAKKTAAPEGIPDLFSNKGEKIEQPEPEADEEVAEETEAAAPEIVAPPPPPRPVAPPPRPAPPAAPVAPARPAAPAVVPAFIPDRQRAQSLGHLFGEPNKKNWTPNEIVHKTITMPGIIGALIALQDGLLVAGSMPPPWKTETIAAFIPQIFGRLTQYTKELQMGEVSTVSFGVETGTLQIFNAGIIYFGALGQPGTALPVEDLTLIATELSRHTK